MSVKSRRRKPTLHLSQYEPILGRCNILLFGLSGAGKSSVVNTLKSTKDIVERVSDVRYTQKGQCTVKYSQNQFNPFCSICDTWGWNRKSQEGHVSKHDKPNYTEKSFNSILGGFMKDDHPMNVEVSSYETPENRRIIDAVIFVVASDVKDNPEVLVHMRKFYQIALKGNIPVFFAVTKVDLWYADLKDGKNILMEKNVRHAASTIHMSTFWKGMQRFIQKNIKHNEAIVLPIINYNEHDTSTNPVIHFLAQEFVKVLTQRIESHYISRSKSNELPSYQNNRYGADLIFTSETALKLNYSEHSDPTAPERETTIATGGNVSEKFLIYDIFYKLLGLGRTQWRFFFIISNSNGIDKLAGLFNPDVEDGYFECVDESISRNILESSFGDRFSQKYTYLGAGGEQHLSEFQETMTKYIKITLAGGKKSMIFTRQKKENWTSFHCMLMNYVQEKKSRDMMSFEFDEIVSSVKKATDDELKRMKGEVVTLKKQLKQVLRQGRARRMNNNRNNNDYGSGGEKLKIIEVDE